MFNRSGLWTRKYQVGQPQAPLWLDPSHAVQILPAEKKPRRQHIASPKEGSSWRRHWRIDMLARQNPYQQSFQKRKKGGSEKKKRDDGALSSKSRRGAQFFAG